ncbi:hypothetical protein MKX03_007903 [Papaver bracteatum]|nr:hypothetical protein MKX03_007903 [Papaver bracteatum]
MRSITIRSLEKESPTGKINRCVVFATTHVTKTINDHASTSASDVKIRKIKELVDADPKGQNDINNDVIAKHVGVIKKVMYEEWEEVFPRPRCVLQH